MINYILRFCDDIRLYKKSGNKYVVHKITLLLEELTAHPFTGNGKPEHLKHLHAGYWSRKINCEHRIIYKVYENII